MEWFLASASTLAGVLRRWGYGLLFIVAAQASHAAVVLGTYSLAGDREGFAGETVSLTVQESQLQGFSQGASLTFSFDSTVLEMLNPDTFFDEATSYGRQYFNRNSDAGGVATYSLFLATDFDVNGALDLFTLNFKIKDGAAPGEYHVAFVNDFSAPVDDGVYDRATLDGTITVLAVPIISTLPLTLTALGLLAAVTLRKRRSHHRRGLGLLPS